MPGISGPPHPSQALELLYVGIASDLHRRIVKRHVRGGTGASTLRRTLAALLTDQAFTVRRTTTRVVLESADEQRLTTWIRQHLLVTWIEHPDPKAVEPDVIAALMPPLNGAHNTDHLAYAEVRAALATWRASAGPRRL